jgi:hypothetical protein
MEAQLEQVFRDKGAVLEEAVKTFGNLLQHWNYRGSKNYMKNDSVLTEENWNT